MFPTEHAFLDSSWAMQRPRGQDVGKLWVRILHEAWLILFWGRKFTITKVLDNATLCRCLAPFVVLKIQTDQWPQWRNKFIGVFLNVLAFPSRQCHTTTPCTGMGPDLEGASD